MLVRDGDDQVREAMTTGLLEDIQNVGSHEESGYEVFSRWLPPLSKAEWLKIDEAWKGKKSLADVVRAERGGSLEMGKSESAAVDIDSIRNPALKWAMRLLYRRIRPKG